jgi:hypothetical protein
MFLGAGSSSAAMPGADGSDEYRYDPMRPNGWTLDEGGWTDPPLDLARLEAEDGVFLGRASH